MNLKCNISRYKYFMLKYRTKQFIDRRRFKIIRYQNDFYYEDIFSDLPFYEAN